MVGKHKRVQSGGGLGIVPSSPGLSGGGLIAVGAVEKELSRLRCRIPSCPSRIRQVTCRGGFLKSRDRVLACIIIISNHSTFRICILRRDGSFLLLQVVARRVLCLSETYILDFVDPGCAFCVFEQYACCCFEYPQLVAHIDWLTWS